MGIVAAAVAPSFGVLLVPLAEPLLLLDGGTHSKASELLCPDIDAWQGA